MSHGFAALIAVLMLSSCTPGAKSEAGGAGDCWCVQGASTPDLALKGPPPPCTVARWDDTGKRAH